MPETSVQRRDEALPDKSGVSMSSISLSLEAEICPEDVRFVRYSRQLCNIVGSVKAFPVQEDDHLRVVLRYIERNPLRAALVERAEDWPWSSLHGASAGVTALIRLDAGPAPRGDGWVEAVNSPMFETEVARVRESIRRDRPLGDKIWTLATAKELGLEYSLHPRGRPPKPDRD